ncbi:MAG TPA: DUF3499 family protein [Acidimicrobiales bacterium]|nr:DUF3499 family protein [Acidimicrobiales bacterium]
MQGARLCVRPGCPNPAEVALRYDYHARRVWLDRLETELAPGVWGMCGGHASGLTVPRGWHMEDNRRPLTLFPPQGA